MHCLFLSLLFKQLATYTVPGMFMDVVTEVGVSVGTLRSNQRRKFRQKVNQATSALTQMYSD